MADLVAEHMVLLLVILHPKHLKVVLIALVEDDDIIELGCNKQYDYILKWMKQLLQKEEQDGNNLH